MQASRTHWSPPSGVLGAILAESEARVAALRARRGELERAATGASPAPPLAAALRESRVAVIAEVKRRSPSKGEIAARLSAEAQARLYEAGGAAAISVLTEPAHFGGEPGDLLAARRGARLPLLRKDFITSELQLVEARALGASGALLIARALPPERLAELADAALEIGLEPLVEVRSEEELEAALATGATLIGVNSRDLETLRLDESVPSRLIPLVPAARVAVYESGVRGRADVERAAACGADAVLVGSALSAATDPEASLLALTGVARRGRP